MTTSRARNLRLWAALCALAIVCAACTSQASKSEYFGKTEPLPDQVLRYISGSETESLDPQIGTSQPDARIYMALYEGLTEYDPKTMEPIPALAERWQVNKDSTEFSFFLRKGAKWSNGDPITAQDFVYTFRRGLSPELASRNAYLAYYIKYGQAYNEGDVFVRDPQSGAFLLEKDFPAEAPKEGEPAVAQSAEPPTAGTTVSPDSPATVQPPQENALAETDFHKFINAPLRLVLPSDEKARAKKVDANPKLKAALGGKEFVPVKAEDIGVEAVDDYTLRITLVQPAPFFIGLIPHQFFRAIHRKTIEQYKEAWTQADHIVVSGPFTLEAWRPYNEIVMKKNPQYWDAGVVKLNKIIFYPFQDNTTKMNLYKAGEVDALSNHTVPAAWLDVIQPLRDYMDAPEVAIEFYAFNCLKGPTTDKRVRKALNMAVDKVALSKWRRITKPLTAFTPEGIFPGYPQPKGAAFNPEEAKKLLAEAGFKDASGKFDPRKFPSSEVELTYNPDGSNSQVAEFVQAQWKQNLGITVPLKSVEFRTFLTSRARLDYKGIARSGWVGDYMDPYTFLGLFSEGGESGSGWTNPKYEKMLQEANATLDPSKRYELLAKAEAFMLEEQPVIPLMTNAVNGMKKPYVKGLQPNPGTLHAWKYVYIEYDRSKWDPSASDMSE
ncbi:MAG TPA: peptide ABC transporter substrate-binding protein [Pyrinomonadaceae bacterium]|jgi:ABC-type oligopeptide transport system substrate-binding subunit|nr:peptide ABC transporter substrate-binding protein [Pyrinomonadaceae bacterium]